MSSGNYRVLRTSNPNYICPICRRILTIAFFIDTERYVQNTVCNDCRASIQYQSRIFCMNVDFVVNLKKINLASDSSSTSSSYSCHKSKRNSYKSIVPQSQWLPESKKRKRNEEVVYDAKLIFHRQVQQSLP